MSYTPGDISGGDPNMVIEPPSAADAQDGKRSAYPYNNTMQTESGHSFEMDDTPTRERVRLQHRDGTFLEMHPGGDEVHKIHGVGYELILKDKKVVVRGTCTISVDGDANIQVKGNSLSTVGGNSTSVVNGQSNISCKGNMKVSASKELKLACDEDIEINCKNLNVTGDLYVQGDIGCDQTITAEGNITSNMCVIGLLSIRSPGALLVGPIPAAYPTLTTGMMDVQVPLYINEISATFINQSTLGFITETAGTFISETAGGFISEKAGTLIMENAGLQILMTTPLIFGAAAITDFSGIVNVTGALNALGALAVTGVSTLTGAVTAIASVTATDFSTINIPSYTSHTHTLAGVATTPPVTGT